MSEQLLFQAAGSRVTRGVCGRGREGRRARPALHRMLQARAFGLFYQALGGSAAQIGSFKVNLSQGIKAGAVVSRAQAPCPGAKSSSVFF